MHLVCYLFSPGMVLHITTFGCFIRVRKIHVVPEYCYLCVVLKDKYLRRWYAYTILLSACLVLLTPYQVLRGRVSRILAASSLEGILAISIRNRILLLYTSP